jgi:hypothetical protein
VPSTMAQDLAVNGGTIACLIERSTLLLRAGFIFCLFGRDLKFLPARNARFLALHKPKHCAGNAGGCLRSCRVYVVVVSIFVEEPPVSARNRLS